MIFKTLPVNIYNYESNCRVTPDGGFIYVGPRAITYIGQVGAQNEAPKVKVFATRQNVKCIDLDPAWGKSEADGSDSNKQDSGKLFAVVAEDRTIQIWDFHLERAICGHNAHVHPLRQGEGSAQSKNVNRVHISYMANSNVLTVDDHDLVIYCIGSNTYCRRPLFISTKNQNITALQCSPHNKNIFAVGTSRGLVLVCDAQSMLIKYTLRGHNHSVISLAWRRINPSVLEDDDALSPKLVPLGLPRFPMNDPDFFDIYNFDYLSSEFGAPVRRRIKSKSSDEFVGTEKIAEVPENPKVDFVEACESLKMDMNHFKAEVAAEKSGAAAERSKNEVTLADCRKRKLIKAENPSNSGSSGRVNPAGGQNDSSEGSLEILQYSSSDDAVVVDGAERKPKHEVLHHIYHQAEVHMTSAASLDIIASELAACGNGDQADHSPRSSSVEIQDECEETKDDILLLSMASDYSLWLWNAQTGGTYHSINKGAGPRMGTLPASAAWLDDLAVVIIDRRQRLVTWKLQYDRDMKRYNFIESPMRVSRLTNVVAIGVCPGGKTVWGVQRNREISLVDMGTDREVAEYGLVTLNGKSIAECPGDMNKIALGLSDKRVGILDMSKMRPEVIAIDNYLGVNNVIQSLAWNLESTILAYGTIDGRIGMVNFETGRHIYDFKPLFTQEVFSLAWHSTQLLSVCNGIVGIYDANNSKADPFVLRHFPRVTALSVRGNFLLVGTQNGELHLYRYKKETALRYECIQRLILLPRYITMIAANPLKKDIFAVVGNDNHVVIVRLRAEQSELEITKKLAYSQSGLIHWAKWSNFNKNLLLFCTRKGSVVVWDLLNPEKEVLDKEFPCPINAAIFLPSDENIVMCCGSSISFVCFDISMELKNESRGKNLTNTLQKVQWATKSTAFLEPQTLSAAEKKRLRKAKKLSANKNGNQSEDRRYDDPIIEVFTDDIRAEISSAMNTIVTSMRDEPNEVADQLQNLRINSQQAHKQVAQSESKPASSFMVHSSSLLYLTGKELNKHALDKLQIVLTGDAAKIQESVHCAKLFGSNAAAKELLNVELNNLKSNDSKSIASVFLTQINLTLKEEISQCIQSKTLCEWHVSLAPTIDYKFWQYCCTSFAEQLVDQGYVLQGATYMMAAHNKYEAIQLLLMKSYFKEALLFARVYLPMTNPIQDKIVKKWIEHLDSNGNLMGAALICVLANDLLSGYQFLSKIRTPTPQITELLQLIKQNGELHLLLGEKPNDVSGSSETPSTSENTG